MKAVISLVPVNQKSNTSRTAVNDRNLNICVIGLVMVFGNCILSLPQMSQTTSVNGLFDDVPALLMTLIHESILAKMNDHCIYAFLENSFGMLCWNWCQWKWTEQHPAGTMYLRVAASERADHSNKRRHEWSMMEKQDGISSEWLLTFEIHTAQQAWQLTTVLPMGRLALS